MTAILLGVVAAYLLGSIPTGYIFGKLLKGVDIREHGSRNVGATNVFRVVGKVPGIIVLVLDIVKGFAAVSLLSGLLSGQGQVINENLFKIILGMAAIAGHNWTAFLKFKGGKGVATSAGVLIALTPKVLVLGLIVWALVFAITRYVSLGSIVAALSVIAGVFIFSEPIEIKALVFVASALMIYRHKSNIGRLLRGEEKRLI